MCFLNLCTSSNLKINLSSLISETINAGNVLISENINEATLKIPLYKTIQRKIVICTRKRCLFIRFEMEFISYYRQMIYSSTTYLQPSKLTFVPSLLLYTVHSPTDVGLRYSSMYSLRYSCPFPLPYLPWNMKGKNNAYKIEIMISYLMHICYDGRQGYKL